MKDIVIPASTIRRELWILLGCLAAAVLVNIYAVIHFQRPAYEVFTQVGFTISVALGLYVLLWIVRLLVLAAVALCKRARKSIAK